MDEVNVIRIRRLLKTETDAELTRDLQTLIAQRDAAQKQVERYEDEIAVIEIELARRQLVVGVLAVGDRLSIIDEVLEHAGNDEVQRMLKRAYKFTISNILGDRVQIAIEWASSINDGTIITVGYNNAVAMRRAYLESEGLAGE